MSTKFYIVIVFLITLSTKVFCSGKGVPPKTTLSITAETQHGESIYVQGEHPLLGNGSIIRSVRLNPRQYPKWELNLDFSQWNNLSNSFKYRFIKRRDQAEDIDKEENYSAISEWSEFSILSRQSNKPSRRIAPRYRLQTIANMSSRYVSNKRPIYIYAPVEIAAKIPICLLYMHDAQQLFKTGPSGWDLENLIPFSNIQNKCTLIVVGVGNSADRMREYLPPYSQGPEGAGIGDKYANFIGRELMPYIENEILAGRPIHRRVIAGASMGGLISLYFSNLSTPWMAKRFDAIMAFSPSIQFSEILSELQHFEGRIYIDSGSTGPGFDHYQEVNFLRDLLLNRGLVFGRDLLHIVGVGHAHQELFWRTRLQENLSWAFNP